MQSLDNRDTYSTIRQTFTMMKQERGFFAPFRGINSMALGAGPAHALYFASYEYFKSEFGGNVGDGSLHFLPVASAAMVATFFHDGFMNPFDVVKQRLQMHNSPYQGVIHCFKNIYATEGLPAFYRSFGTQLALNVPFQAINFSVYEYLKTKLVKGDSYNPLGHVIAGAGAGACAAALTTPLDVVKTLLNTQERAGILGFQDATRTIFQSTGLMGFTRGLSARVIFQMPSTAVSWGVYEFFKHVLHFDKPTSPQIVSPPVSVAPIK